MTAGMPSLVARGRSRRHRQSTSKGVRKYLLHLECPLWERQRGEVEWTTRSVLELQPCRACRRAFSTRMPKHFFTHVPLRVFEYIPESKVCPCAHVYEHVYEHAYTCVVHVL